MLPSDLASKVFGIIRGGRAKTKALNPTLASTTQFGMQLHFVSREAIDVNKTQTIWHSYNNNFQTVISSPKEAPMLWPFGDHEVLKPSDQQFDLI